RRVKIDGVETVKRTNREGNSHAGRSRPARTAARAGGEDAPKGGTQTSGRRAGPCVHRRPAHRSGICQAGGRTVQAIGRGSSGGPRSASRGARNTPTRAGAITRDSRDGGAG